ncbi:MAG: protein-L-isoaspartate(D-aspartate) O-methyltransferase [Woeseiaceae bacterium]|nr:protein-L-isoaspartate(D-aspartate) O-methyltransferase [Woeseiaceae bacterium]
MQRLADQGIRSQAVLEQIRNVPRHLFVDEALASRAYEDTALPIGLGQTISQPFVVARMTEALLEHSSPGRILEIGTGCGYQTAVLAPLVKQIYTVERIPELYAAKTRQRLRNPRHLQCAVSPRRRLGGLAEVRALHDGRLVAAAASRVPEKLLEQLAPGGSLILPVGGSGRQELTLLTRLEDRYEQQSLGAVSFVPLVSGK